MAQKIQIDFSKVSDSGSLPVGKYPVRVTDAVIKETSDGTGFFVQWSLVVTVGEYEGATLVHRTSLKNTVLWRLKAILRNFGFDVSGNIDFEVDGEENRIVSPELVDSVGVAVLIEDTYQGITRSVVSDILSIDELEDEPEVARSTPAPRTAKSTGGLKLK